MLHQEITSKVLASFYKVYNTLGYGFLEKVYENALYYELTGIGKSPQFSRKIFTNGIKKRT